MRKQIYLYLFLITALVLLFVIVNTKKDKQDFEGKKAKLELKMADLQKKYEDTIANLRLESFELAKFSLAEDAYAREYLYNANFDVDELIPHVQDQIIDLNTAAAEGNPLVPYDPLMGDKMLVNSVKMLNHKWIIADFTDGKFWGQILVNMEINEDQSLSFTTKESFLYPEYKAEE